MEARETLGLLAVGLAVGAASEDPKWRLTVGTRNGAHHTEASQWARNGLAMAAHATGHASYQIYHKSGTKNMY